MSVNALFILVIIIIAFLGLFVVPRFRMKRAMRQVIQIFRYYNALDEKSAKTIFELGLQPRGIMDGMFKGRDFRPYALQILQRSDVVRLTEDGKLYLSEEQLNNSGIEQQQPTNRLF